MSQENSNNPSSRKRKVVKTTLKSTNEGLQQSSVAQTEEFYIAKLLNKTIHSEIYLGETTSGDNRALITTGVEDPEVIEEFRNSCEKSMPLKHFGIVKIFEMIENNGKAYAVCELVEAVNLRDLVSSIGVFDTKEEFFHILNQVCEAVKYAHGLGVVHGNLKTSNVLLCERDGEVFVKLTEFARSKFKSISLEKQGLRPDTDEIVCWSPEHCKGEEPTEASDVYQVGLLAYYMLVGKMPYEYNNPDSIIKSHIDPSLKPEPITKECQIQNNAEELNEFILEAIDPNPDWRLQSIDEFHKRLLEWYQHDEAQVDLGQMSLDDMIDDAISSDYSSITPSNARKVSTTVHNLVALKKKQVDQDETVLMKLSEKVSAKGPRLSPLQSISKLGVTAVFLVLLSGTLYYVFVNHGEDVGYLWKEVSLRAVNATSADDNELEVAEVDNASVQEASSTVFKKGAKQAKPTKPSVVPNQRRKKIQKIAKYPSGKEYYKNLRYGVTNNTLIKQGKSNRRIIDYTKFDENWLK